MQSRSLRFLIILTLLASIIGVSGFGRANAAVAAAPPPKEPGKHQQDPRPSPGVAPNGANQAGIAAPGGQTAVGWGYDDDLYFCNGDFNYNDVYAPKPTVGLSGVTAVAAGYDWALYLLSDGTVYGCGYDGDGALGNGRANGDDYGAPQQVLGVCPSPSPSPSASPSASPSPSPAPSHTAAECGRLTNIKAIAAGYDHSLALDKDGNVYAWGRNEYGQLGTGSSLGPEGCGGVYSYPNYQTGQTEYARYSPCSTTPVKVPGLSNIVQIVAGYEFSVALKADGTVYAWGSNDYGQLGREDNGPQDCPYSLYYVDCNGTPYYFTNSDCSPTPIPVTGLPRIVQVATGMYSEHVLALDVSGHVWAWGYNDDGELGRGFTSDYEYIPARVVGPGGTGLLDGVAQPDPAHPYFERIAANEYSSYAVLTDGTVVAWGYNSYGELGIGSTDGQPSNNNGDPASCFTYPVTVHGVDNVGSLGNIVSLGSGGDSTAYAISADQHLYAWGYNGYGQLGIGAETDDRTTPVIVLGAGGNGRLSNVLAVSASYNDWVIAVLAPPSPQYTVTAIVSGNGTVTPAGATAYNNGDVASYTADAGCGPDLHRLDARRRLRRLRQPAHHHCHQRPHPQGDVRRHPALLRPRRPQRARTGRRHLPGRPRHRQPGRGQRLRPVPARPPTSSAPRSPPSSPAPSAGSGSSTPTPSPTSATRAARTASTTSSGTTSPR